MALTPALAPDRDGITARGALLRIGVLALFAAYFMVWPVWRVPFPLEIAPYEGWNAYHADAAASGVLYPANQPLVVNNYPPLSFYALGYAQKIFGGDALILGRVLSLFATTGIAILIFVVIRRLGARREAAAVGGLWFLATVAQHFNHYVGADEPQLVAQFFMLLALAWFLRRQRDGNSAEPPILLMVLAGFYKHNVIAIPATALCWLAVQNWRSAVRPALVGAAAAAIGLAICLALYGDAFIANFLTARPHDFVRAIKGLGRLQWVLPALVMWGIWAWVDRRETWSRFTLVYVAIAFAAYVAQWTGEDVLDSAQFDLVIATAVSFGVGFDRIAHMPLVQRMGVEWARAAAVAVLAIRLLATLHIEPFLVLTDPAYRAQFRANSDIARAEAARIGAIPGPVACDYKIICRMAGKPFVYDDFRADMIIATHAAPGATVQDLIRQNGLTYVAIDPRVDMEALRRTMFGY